jgi:AmiR/NasT family two-component response regulator
MDQDQCEAMAREIEQLRCALVSRDIIGQAKGILMERFQIDAAAAFDLLVELSQHSNTPVAVIARKVLRSASRAETRKGRSRDHPK